MGSSSSQSVEIPLPAQAVRPTVSVVVATRDRPVLLRRAIRSFLDQTYAGIAEVVVVFDRCPVDDLADMSVEGGPRLVTLANTRTPGLAGARNTGIAAAEGDLVAFCDDDDEWLPEKLTRQVDLWQQHPEAAGVGTGMSVHTEDSTRVRIAPARVEHEDFLDSRVFSIPSSGFLLRREDLVGPAGEIDEELPSSYGEDWDLLLRRTRSGSFINVPDPLVRVYWDRPSFFTAKWETISAALQYMLAKHPELSTRRVGMGRLFGQIAFAEAAIGRRRSANRWLWGSLRRTPLEMRSWAALAVVLRVVSPGRLVIIANSRGRGL